jgi:hypothetical protein
MNLTSEQCDAFRFDQNTNPKTRRYIQTNGATYNLIKNYCLSKEMANKSAPKNIYRSPQKNIEKSPQENSYRYVPTPNKPKKIIIYVPGLGCSLTSKAELSKYAEDFAFIMNTEVHIMCANKIVSALAKGVCLMRPLLKDKFVVDVYNETTKYIKNDYTVFLIGHSYGGAVVTRVAELFSSDLVIPNPNKLIITTIGSTYIPAKIIDNGINLFHYMFDNDIALKCNKLNFKKDKRSDLKWLHPVNYNYLSGRPKNNFSFASLKQWKMRHDYPVHYILDERGCWCSKYSVGHKKVLDYEGFIEN